MSFIILPGKGLLVTAQCTLLRASPHLLLIISMGQDIAVIFMAVACINRGVLHMTDLAENSSTMSFTSYLMAASAS